MEVNPGPVLTRSKSKAPSSLTTSICQGLKLCHWNIQHLTDSKFEEIKVMFSKELKDFDVVYLTETFCTSKIPDLFYYIPGYALYRKDRLRRKGGGILAFVNMVVAKRRPDLEADGIESLWLEVCPYKCKRSLFIGGTYRPPSYQSADERRLAKNIENVYLKNNEIILLGDFNVDYLTSTKFKKHPLIKTLYDLHLVQLVNAITRPLSDTCLDHIWSSHPERMNTIRTISSGLSGHLPIVGIRTFKRETKNGKEHTTITYRDFKKLNKEQLNNAFMFEDSNDVLDAWYKVFEDVVNTHLPLKHKRVKRNILPKWFTSEISQEIKQRDKLL